MEETVLRKAFGIAVALTVVLSFGSFVLAGNSKENNGNGRGILSSPESSGAPAMKTKRSKRHRKTAKHVKKHRRKHGKSRRG